MNIYKLGILPIPTPSSVPREPTILDIERYLWKGVPMTSSININDRKFKKLVWDCKADIFRKKNELAKIAQAAREKIENLNLTADHILFCGKCDTLIHYHQLCWPPFSQCYAIQCYKCETDSCLPGQEEDFIKIQEQAPLYFTE